VIRKADDCQIINHEQKRPVRSAHRHP
jgi:hypothetical protein